MSLAEAYERKAHAYRRFGTGNVATAALTYLPEGGSLLDVGCASGGLLREVRDHAGYLAGIELSTTAARAAAEIADEVVTGSVTDPDLELAEAPFDVVVCADVIEHVPEPEAALARARTWCRPGGVVIVSVPNIAYWAARWRLLRGIWRYEETGIFDRGHLRFFTRSTLLEVLASAGLEAVGEAPVVPRLRNHIPVVARLPDRVQRRIEAAWQRLGRRFPGLMAFQLVVVARPR